MRIFLLWRYDPANGRALVGLWTSWMQLRKFVRDHPWPDPQPGPHPEPWIEVYRRSVETPGQLAYTGSVPITLNAPVVPGESAEEAIDAA